MESLRPTTNKEIKPNKPEKRERKPEAVISFLREHNHGRKGDESARASVEEFTAYMRGLYPHHKIPFRERHLVLPSEQYREVDLFVSELEKAGFARPHTIRHDRWTKQAERALFAVLADFEKRPVGWQVTTNKAHERFRYNI